MWQHEPCYYTFSVDITITSWRQLVLYRSTGVYSSGFIQYLLGG